MKRASSLKQYIAWFHTTCTEFDTYVCSLPLAEDDVWRYFLHLRALTRTSKHGYTVSGTFLETIKAKNVFTTGPLNQTPPLEVEHLQRLHEVLDKGANDIDRIGAGAFLCAVYARARWSDLRYIHHIKYAGYKRNATMDLYTAEHKTSSTDLTREQFLPLVIPSKGIVHGDWLGTFIELCHSQGTDWEKVPFGPLLPAPKPEGGWCVRPLSTSEAAAWLKRLLEG